LQAAARLAKDAPQKFLEMRDIFGELSQHNVYVGAFSDALSQLWARGVRPTLGNYLSDPP
jgi:mannitol 2-dehydrogenase